MEIRHKFSGYFQLPPEPFPFAELGRKIPLSRAEQREDFPV